jgi:hypothetical protein
MFEIQFCGMHPPPAPQPPLSTGFYFLCVGAKERTTDQKTHRKMTKAAQRGKTTLQGKLHLCIPFLGIARHQSQYPHSSVCEQFIIYSQDWSTYFPAAE